MSHDKSDDEALEDPMRPMDMVNALLGKVETTPIDISVVIPHLNQPEHLRRSLEAVHTQKGLRANFEVIVVDNGSKTLPKDICALWPDVTLLQEPTPGPGPARNKGVSAAKGQIIACVDADCRAESHWLATILAAFEDPDVEIIGGDVQVPYQDRMNPTALEAYERVYAYRNHQYVASGYSGTGNLAFRKTAFERVGGFGGIEIAEDKDWGLRAGKLGVKTHFVPAMIVYHPARTHLDDMKAKWDRHIGHDHSKVSTMADKARFLAKALALAVSPLAEVPNLMRTSRLRGVKERLLAFACLTRVRLYRAKRMLGVLITGNSAALSGAWNRK